MKQLGLGLNLSTRKTLKREFLEEMERVVPWGALVQIVEAHYPKARPRPPAYGGPLKSICSALETPTLAI